MIQASPCQATILPSYMAFFSLMGKAKNILLTFDTSGSWKINGCFEKRVLTNESLLPPPLLLLDS